MIYSGSTCAISEIPETYDGGSSIRAVHHIINKDVSPGACSYINSLRVKVNFILSKTQEAIECLKNAFSRDPSIKKEFAKEYPEIKASKLFRKLLDEN
jgi:hypothetical protein